MRSKFVCCLCLVLVLLNSSIIYALDTPLENPFFTLILVANPNNQYAEYALHVAEYLADINIGVEIQYHAEIPSLISFYWDLLFGEYSKESPDMRPLYSEDGSLNIFGLNKEIPYCNESEQLQNQAVLAYDLDAKNMYFNEWIGLFTDKVLPLLPFFNPREYDALWSNTEGYDMRWGLSDSLPYMNYNGLHEGQVSFDKFNIADSMWQELNPLFSKDDASNLIIDLISERILTLSPENAPLKTGIVNDWDQISDTHFKFYLSDDIFWNPSYNVTTNVDDSIPLENSPLMSGLKGGQSNGFNQQVTAKDVIFTLLTNGNSLICENSITYEWLSDCYVDEGDSLSFHIITDGNPLTFEKEPYVYLFNYLSTPILPEFFLNSTSSTVSYTDGGIKCWGLYPEIINTPQWKTYTKSAFNCGKYMLYYSIENAISVLQKNPNWFGVGAIDGDTGKQPFVERIDVKCIPDLAEALIVFKQGKLDLMDVTQFPAERKLMQADARYQVQTQLSDTVSFLAFNLKRPIIGGPANYIFLDEPGKEEYTKALAVRKAICLSIDREEISQIEHDGEYSIIHEPFYWYSGLGGWDSTKYYKNVDAALEWMASAGYLLDTAKTGSTYNLLALLTLLVSSTFVLKFIRRRKQRS